MATNSANVTAHNDSRVQIGNNYSTTVHNHGGSNHNSCLADLRLANPLLADPRDEKARIEQTKGGLYRDAYKWILENDEFHRWRHDERSRVLWIKGDAGKGKTMLLCGIIDELSQGFDLSSLVRRPVLLSHFFCQATDTGLNTAVAVLRGLIYLMLLQRPPLLAHLQERRDHGSRQIFEGPNAFFSMSQTLLSMLRDPVTSGAFLVIDALDECEIGLS